MIEINSLNKYYDKNHVLKNINIQFSKGIVYGIVGENGAGKTTLFRCIAGLEKYDGAIKSDFTNLKNHLGFLMTDPFIFNYITGAEYIQLLCNARNKKPGNILERNIFELPLNKYASTYSTGMKKKLALTAILMQENDCLILDEPFNGVDIQSNMIITDIIRRLKELCKTIIISSHIFSTLNDTCDEIHVLKEGEFVKRIEKKEFNSFEEEMKRVTIGSKVDTFGLR